jgi:hypothetical protein
VVPDLYKIRERLDPQRLIVAVHLRAGDFGSAEAPPRPGEFNRALPREWYRNVVANVAAEFGERAQFLLFSDEVASRDAMLVDNASVVQLPARERPMLSDLLSMAFADLLVCSVSSFSLLAGFLSDHPYAWYAPHLYERGGWRSIWGYESFQQSPGGLTSINVSVAENDVSGEDFGRGFAIQPDGCIPDRLAEILRQRLATKQLRRDLLYYGVVR